MILKLYDEDLQGVDPYDPNLTNEYRLKIIMECRKNMQYFIEKVMKIPAPGDPMIFKLLGYNPNGVYCDECTRLSCQGCKNTDTKEKYYESI